ncbi:FHA domain-containing protein [Stieleria varia]|nr:FHA domain-containing protein [Stieleria varia]
MSQSNQSKSAEFALHVLRPSAAPIVHPLKPGRSVFIGRSETCGIRVHGKDVADIHCLVDVDSSVVSIQDWASATGTHVNGRLIDDKTELRIGDQITVGEAELTLVGNVAASVEAAERRTTEIAAETPHDMADDCQDEETDSFSEERCESPLSSEEASTNPHLEKTSSHSAHQIQPPSICASSWGDSTDMSMDDMDVDGLDAIAANDWDDASDDWGDEDAFDADTVGLLKAEIEDLRIQLSARDEQIAMLRADSFGETHAPDAIEVAQHSDSLVGRMDDMLAEMAEHDERVRILQELLETAEIQNQAEKEERSCLENWLGEIEQRVSERESEWTAESDGLRERLSTVAAERDQLQQQMQDVARRYNAPQCHEENITKLQEQNTALLDELEKLKRENAALMKEVEKASQEEPESLQEERAKLARERADVSRLRFQLSKQLSEFDTATPEAKEQPDREFALRLRTLREHLREIHEEEKEKQQPKSDSLFGRISGLWKRVDDEY